jgi:hypothetical protein
MWPRSSAPFAVVNCQARKSAPKYRTEPSSWLLHGNKCPRLGLQFLALIGGPMSKKLLYAGLLFLIFTPIALSQTVVVAGSVNGVLNPTQYAGSDIGAKVNTAWKSGKTVRIPWGTYSFSTTIAHPGEGYELECDAGAVLDYTGSGDAITMPGAGTGTHVAGIDGDGGCLLQGNATAQSGIHLNPSGHAFVRNIRIWGFTNANHGYGIYDTGANSVELNNIDSEHNTVGVYLTGVTSGGNGYAANAVHIEDSEISSNSTWGVISEDSGCACTQNLGNVISNNVLEGNGSGDLYLDWEFGTTVSGNYFESSGINIELGNGQNVWGVNIGHNYFSASSAVESNITIRYGSNFNIEENAVIGGTASGCFANVITNPWGPNNLRGVGTNYTPSENEWCVNGTKTTTP